MSASNYLIDTNVFIELEDPNEVNSELAALLQLAARHHVGVFVHEAAQDDIQRDKNISRQRISLSKIAKFQILTKVRGLTPADLSAQFGPLGRPNDIVDATLLHALKIGVADFLVTEDRALHDRTKRHVPDLTDRVLYIADAVALLRSTYEPLKVSIPFVEEVDAHSIALTDPIFDSLRDGYPEFDRWWKDKCIKGFRKCWAVIEGNAIAGLVVRKTERAGYTDASLPGHRVLKICTFKVRPEHRGIKLGELLLKQVLWFAQANHFDVVYLTTYAVQTTLIDLIEYYGFQHTYSKPDGELVYEKQLASRPIEFDKGSIFDLDRQWYPTFYAGAKVRAYGVPIKETYHRILFPELADHSQQDLFGTAGLGPRTPGNTIRKVYLCRAPAKLSQPGAVLFFYKGLSQHPPSQSMTTVGIFENVALANSTEELRRLAGGRSVYSNRQLEAFRATPENPVKVINFLLAGHIQPAISLAELRSALIVKSHPPQSIFQLSQVHLNVILSRARGLLEKA